MLQQSSTKLLLNTKSGNKEFQTSQHRTIKHNNNHLLFVWKADNNTHNTHTIYSNVGIQQKWTKVCLI